MRYMGKMKKGTRKKYKDGNIESGGDAVLDRSVKRYRSVRNVAR